MEHRTDDIAGKYATEESVENARAMMGWDDQASVVIDPPAKRTVRISGRMVEQETPAWVKFSTEFKSELSEMNEYSLKVFIYIGLSVNFQTGDACPGVRKIASDTHMDKDTVSKAVADLEEKGFLSVQKRVGNSNVYKPIRFIAIGRGVPSEGTPKNELSGESSKVSLGGRVNLHNKNKQENLNDDESKAVSERVSTFSKLYESNIGPLTPLSADLIRCSVIDYPDVTWYEPAFKIAVGNNKRHINYVIAILQGWKEHYFGWKPEFKNNGSSGKGTAHENRKTDNPIDPEQIARDRATADRIKARRAANVS